MLKSKYFYKFSFWFVIFAVFVNCFNSLGYDDKNLLLFFTSPPFWILENVSHKIRSILYGDTLFFIYIVNALFWFLLGFYLDKMIAKLKMNISLEAWEKIKMRSRVLVFSILILSFFAIGQYSRPTISKEQAMKITREYFDDEKIEIGTHILSDDFFTVVSGNRYWLIGIEKKFIRLNAYDGKIIEVE